jgi:hypothetical protein
MCVELSIDFRVVKYLKLRTACNRFYDKISINLNLQLHAFYKISVRNISMHDFEVTGYELISKD